MTLVEIQSRLRRRSILQTLTAASDYQLNDEIIFLALQDIGHRCSREQAAADLAFLAQRGLVKIAKSPQLVVVTLTGKGEDVAEGRQLAEGVERPKLTQD